MDTKIIVAPQRVYRATDRSMPRWRFFIAAVNTSRRHLRLERVTAKTWGGSKANLRTYSGERLEGLIRQGGLLLKPKQVVALEMADDGDPRAADRVSVRLRFSTRSGGALDVAHTVRLREYPTVWLQPPLTGAWLAANARGDQHCLGKQFGFDLITLEDFPRHENPPKGRLRLRDFSSFGKPIFAPIEGTVVSRANHLPDFRPTPGQSTYGSKIVELRKMLGNHVLLALEGERYLLLAHLRRGSVLVEREQRVAAGERIGEVGNSGNTSGPHLHIELMDGMPDMVKLSNETSGLPFGFRNVTRIRNGVGKTMARCVPAKMDVVDM